MNLGIRLLLNPVFSAIRLKNIKMFKKKKENCSYSWITHF